jgi:2-polyprenyl-3-methyl-5-hydroxy-6-metoxy-1,4-benzoquinol methylase
MEVSLMNGTASSPQSPSSSPDRVEQLFRLVERERFFSPRGNWGTAARLRFYLENLFAGIAIEGKRVLDIGAGSGVFSVYLALCGAAEVCALEPEVAGSRTRTAERFERMVQVTGASNVTLRPQTFEDAAPTLAPSDVVLLHNSINHFDEPACMVLDHDAAARSAYVRTFEGLARLTRPGGLVVVADCTRHNVFHTLGLRSPLCPTIEWEKHQPPLMWAAVAEEAGLHFERLQWTTPGHLGTLSQRVLGNPVAAYFLLGHFALVLRNVGGAAPTGG